MKNFNILNKWLTMAPTVISPHSSSFLSSQSSNPYSLDNVPQSPNNISNLHATQFQYFYYPMKQNSEATPIVVSGK